MSSLAQKKCVPCNGGVPTLTPAEIAPLIQEIGPSWTIIDDGHHLEKKYIFSNFVKALAFTNNVGAVAEAEGHHPDIFLRWGKVTITIWTHTIDGLSESDFILAAKCDEIYV
jgi:4a-hydroxytetrahydrobiopterin dehydratase